MYLDSYPVDENGRYYRIREDFSVNGKKQKHTLYNIGYIANDDKDQLEHWKKFLEDFKILYQKIEEIRQKIILEQEDSSNPSLNLGFCFIKAILARYDMREVFAYYQRTHDIGYQVYQYFFYEIYSTIIDPTSILGSVEEQNQFFEHFNLELWDAYRSLDIIHELFDSINQRVAQKTLDFFAESDSLFYIDSTNVFTFTLPDEPAETKSKDEKTTRRYLRQYGKSKENRKLPLVRIILVYTTNGLPLLIRCYEGNRNDQRTLIPFLRYMEKLLDLDNYLICADSGYNSATNNYFLAGPNLAHTSQERYNNGFVFSKSFRNTDEIASWILNKQNWKYVPNKNSNKEKIIEGEDGKLSPPEVDAFGYKSRIITNDNNIWNSDFTRKLNPN